jgi:tetratricopeptide (TPR) repeat protein
MAEALEEAEEGLRLDPLHGPCAAVRGLALQHLDRWDEAADAYRDALAIDPEMVIPHAGLGYIALGRREGKEAAEAFRSALRLDPGCRWAQSGLPEALRHTFPGYGRIDRWVARLRALALRKRGGLGCLLCILILLFIGSSPPWFIDQDFSWTGILLWMARLLVVLGTWAWCFSIWVVRPLYELALHSHPVGRWLVEPVHLRESRILAGALLLAVLLLTAGAAFSWSRGALLGVVLLLCLPPMRAVHRSGTVGWRGGERGFTVFALLLGVLGTLLPAEFGVAGIRSGIALATMLMLHSFFISFTET